MQLSEIHEQWEEDCKLDRTELGEESLRIPQLHSKYYKIYSEERSAFRKYEGQFKKLQKVKFEYYNGTISEEELNENGWEPFQIRVLKTDVPIYLDSDPDIVKAKSILAQQQEKVEFVEAIIKSLPQRGYQIKAAIDWEKFKVGA